MIPKWFEQHILQYTTKSILYFSSGFTLLVGGYALSSHIISLKLIPALICIFMLLLTNITLLLRPFPSLSTRLLKSSPLYFFKILLVIYFPFLIYTFGTLTFSFHSLVILTLFMFIPSFLALTSHKLKTNQQIYLHIVMILCIWLPFDFRWLDDIWIWPENIGAYPLNTLLAVNLVILLFIGLLDIQDVGLPIRKKQFDFLLLLKFAILFFAIALPIGFVTNFIAFNPQWTIFKVLVTPISIFLFIAIPEELLFRGLMQNLIAKKLKNPQLGLYIASIVFGLSHLNNDPIWSIPYLMLSTLAGFIYGILYSRTKSLLMPALMHTLVDTIWVLFLLKPI